MTVADVYFLALHTPYQDAEHPRPINATIVHALTLLHPELPQPDGGRIYRCLTEFPGRTPGCVVPLSTLTFELGGGLLWDDVGDWERVVDSVVRLARSGRCDAMPIGLPDLSSHLLANGPNTTLHVTGPEGPLPPMGGRERQAEIEALTGHVRSFAAQGPFWPGDDLTGPPAEPRVMPYRPARP